MLKTDIEHETLKHVMELILEEIKAEKNCFGEKDPYYGLMRAFEVVRTFKNTLTHPL